MADEIPPQGFNWNLGPRKPEEPDEQNPQQSKYSPSAPSSPQNPFGQAPPPQNLFAQAPPPQAVPPSGATQPPPQSPFAQAPPPQSPFAQEPPRPAAANDVPTQAMSFEPTQAMSLEPTQAMPLEPTQAMSFDPALAGPTEVLGAVPVGIPEPFDERPRPPQSGSAIDALFGANQFKEYEASAFPSEGISALASTRPRVQREPMSVVQKTLLWVAGGLAAALALVGLFVLGTTIGPISLFPQAEPEVVQSAPPVAAVQAIPPPVGPVAVGTHSWDELLGTECIEPYSSPWDEEFTVVDCAQPHAAQMIFHGFFADEAFAPYPGVEQLQSRINLLCTSPTSVNYAAARQFADIQVAASYAATEQDWQAGERDFYCFVSRSSGEPLTASVANAPTPSDALVPTVPSNDP